MKDIKQIREQYDLITEKDENEERKLTSLVRAGLFDAKKLPALKHALEKGADKMTAQEKRMLLNLLDSLMNQVLSDNQVYKKVKQNVMKENAPASTWQNNNYMTNDPRWSKGWPQIPSVILLKKKAVRVYPDGQKVVLYYAQTIDKYVTIPFSERGADMIPGINEEVELDENRLKLVGAALGAVGKATKTVYGAVKNKIAKIKAKRASAGAGAGAGTGAGIGAGIASALSGSGNSGSANAGPKYLEPGKAKLTANIAQPKREGGSDSQAERDRQLSRKAMRNQLNEFAPTTIAKTAGSGLNQAKRVRKQVKDMLKQFDDVKTKTPEVSKPPVKAPEGKVPAKVEPAKPPVKMPEVPKTPSVGTNITSTISKIGSALEKISLPVAVATTLGKGSLVTSDSELGKKTHEYIQKKKSEKIALKQAEKGFGKDSGGVNLPKAPTKPDTGIQTKTKEIDGSEPQNDTKLQTQKLPDAKSSNPTKLDTKPQTAPTTTAKPDTKPAPAPEPAPSPKGLGSAAVGAAIATLMRGGSGGGTDAPAKPLTPKSGKLKANIFAPKREGGSDALKSRDDQLSRKALRSQLNEQVDLGGNIFEINSRVSRKVVNLYESLNATNKRKMIATMKESDEGLQKIISFAVRQ